MTEERKKYMGSISKEEREIRQAISDCRRMIKHGKEGIGKYKDRPRCFGNILLFENFKDDVRFNKIYLKSLKKRLPAPKEKIELIRGRYYMFVCSVCGASTVEGTYCPYCGQKLR